MKSISMYMLYVKLKAAFAVYYTVNYTVAPTDREQWSYTSESRSCVKDAVRQLRSIMRSWRVYKTGPLHMPTRRMWLTEAVWRITYRL